MRQDLPTAVKLLVLASAVKQAGCAELEEPFEHILAFYLSKKAIIPFDEYVFAGDYCPPFDAFPDGISYPRSLGLTGDLNRLGAWELINVAVHSISRYSITPRGTKIAASFLAQVDSTIGTKKFTEIISEVADKLSDKRSLLNESYRMYLAES